MLVSISWVLIIHEKQTNSTIIKNNQKKLLDLLIFDII